MYYNSELNTAYNFVVKENNLIATHSRNGNAILTAFQPDFFVSNIGAIEVIRNNQNKVIGFNILTQGIRRIKFDKIYDK